MIAKEFISELRGARGFVEWELRGAMKHIRGRLKKDGDGTSFDPITALCYLKTGKLFNEDDWLAAATELGLSWIDSGDLNAAANNVAGPLANEIRVLRENLLDAVMLQDGPEESAIQQVLASWLHLPKKKSAGVNY